MRGNKIFLKKNCFFEEVFRVICEERDRRKVKNGKFNLRKKWRWLKIYYKY